MKRKFIDIPVADRKGVQFLPMVKFCVENLPHGLAWRCFGKMVEVIQEYCTFHGIVAGERIPWEETLPPMQGVEVVDLLPAPVTDHVQEALQSAGLEPVLGPWGSASSSATSAVVMVRPHAMRKAPTGSTQSVDASSRTAPLVPVSAALFTPITRFFGKFYAHRRGMPLSSLGG